MYNITKTKAGFKYADREFKGKTIYHVVNALLCDIYTTKGEYRDGTVYAPKKQFVIYVPEWVDIRRLNNRFNINFVLLKESSNQVALF